PPIVANTAVIPFVLKHAYHAEGAVPFFALTVFVGEFVCCGILGTALLYAIPKSLRKELDV
ncbi:MAG: QueT transporter family protein, partial [Clostridia bacterium]|nr:QueT transporter family protein [Clostridia bacterium]